MMTGIEIVFFLLYCGIAVALAIWASRVRMAARRNKVPSRVPSQGGGERWSR
jgi:hypothetical protein